MSDIRFPFRSKSNEQFTRWLFETPDGPIKLTRKNDLGKMFVSRVRYSGKPVESNGTELELSGVGGLKLHWLYYTADDVLFLNDAIDSFLTLDLMFYVLENRFRGSEYKDIYITYLLSRGLEFDDKIMDMLKKRDYRFRKRSENEQPKPEHRVYCKNKTYFGLRYRGPRIRHCKPVPVQHTIWEELRKHSDSG